MVQIRKSVVTVDEIIEESGKEVSKRTAKVIAAAVVKNPLAGKPLVSDLTELELMSVEVTQYLADKAMAALASVGLKPSDVTGYGKVTNGIFLNENRIFGICKLKQDGSISINTGESIAE